LEPCCRSVRQPLMWPTKMCSRRKRTNATCAWSSTPFRAACKHRQSVNGDVCVPLHVHMGGGNAHKCSATCNDVASRKGIAVCAACQAMQVGRLQHLKVRQVERCRVLIDGSAAWRLPVRGCANATQRQLVGIPTKMALAPHRAYMQQVSSHQRTKMANVDAAHPAQPIAHDTCSTYYARYSSSCGEHGIAHP
jgi:hypothetical protein